MGQTMLDELTRFLEGSPLKHRITRDSATIMA